MKTVVLITLGFFLIAQCHPSPTNLNDSFSRKENSTSFKNAGNDTIAITNNLPRTITTNRSSVDRKIQAANNTSFTDRNKAIEDTAVEEISDVLASKNAVVIDLEKVNKMSILEYVGRRVKSLWNYLIDGQKEEPQSTFIAFLILFSLKTIGLLGLILLLNVGTIAAKLGAYLASKKSEHTPQNLHVHVQPWKNDEHHYSSSHLAGPPYGWDDRGDTDVESHELYNLYEKLKFQNNLRRYLYSTNSRT